MEEVAEGILKSILKTLSLVVRFLVWIVLDLYFDIVGWYVGWPVCRGLSLGYYPKEGLREFDEASDRTTIIVWIIGLIFLISLGTILAQLIGAI